MKEVYVYPNLRLIANIIMEDFRFVKNQVTLKPATNTQYNILC